MCLALALTAARLGAAVTNYTEVTELIKSPDGYVAGAKVKDAITGTPRHGYTAEQVFGRRMAWLCLTNVAF